MYKAFPIITFVMTIIMTGLSHDYTKILAWLILLLSYRKAQDEEIWYSPYYLFMVTIISYILYWEKLGGIYMSELTDATRLFVVSSLLAVVFGFTFCQLMHKKTFDIGERNENFYLVFLIGLLPTAISYILYGNITELEGDAMLEAKKNFSLPVIGQLAYFLPASIVVACKKDNTKLIVLASIFSILAALLTISKTALLLSFIYFLIGS